MKRSESLALLALLIGLAASAIVGCKTHENMQAASDSSYPLTKCVVSGEDLGDKPYAFVHNGQTVKLCCKDCLAKFNAEPDKYMAKLNTPR